MITISLVLHHTMMALLFFRWPLLPSLQSFVWTPWRHRRRLVSATVSQQERRGKNRPKRFFSGFFSNVWHIVGTVVFRENLLGFQEISHEYKNRFYFTICFIIWLKQTFLSTNVFPGVRLDLVIAELHTYINWWGHFILLWKFKRLIFPYPKIIGQHVLL